MHSEAGRSRPSTDEHGWKDEDTWEFQKGQSTGGCEEDAVVVRDGELLQGILDKKQFGAEMYGIVHSVFELYGPTVAGKLLTVFGRLYTAFLQGHGFTCGIDDLLLSQDAENTRHSLQSKIGGSSAEVERGLWG